MNTIGLRLVSTGKALPERAISNEEMRRFVETSDEWIRSRTGIASRYMLEEDALLLPLAISAAEQALAGSGIAKEEIGCVIAATITPDYTTPSMACLIGSALSLPCEIPMMDVNAACSGFIYALEAARGFLLASGKRYALLIGCEAMSRLLDMTDRSTCVLFGDGAGAAVFEAAADAPYASHHGAQGSMTIWAGRARGLSPILHMDGAGTYRFAVETMPRCANMVLEKAGLVLEDVDHFVCHQANERIIDACAKRLRAPQEKFYKNMHRYGNTSAASIPLALADMQEEGLLASGQRLLCVGFGAGLTWAGALFTVK